jgi:hypothetical protein
VLRPAEFDLACEAAELQMAPLRRGEDPIRRANVISRILSQIGLVDRHGKREPPDPLLLTLDPPQVAPSGNARISEPLWPNAGRSSGEER